MNRFSYYRLKTPFICIICFFLTYISHNSLAKDRIQNPYYKFRQWKVWELEPDPITIQTYKGKKRTVSLPPQRKRLFPYKPPATFPPKQFVNYARKKRSKPKFSGFWADVYASWDKGHSFINQRWNGGAKNVVPVRDHMITLVGATFGAGNKKILVDPQTAGINYASQSTTSMGHPHTNKKGLYDRLEGRKYFSNIVFAGPANSSYKDIHETKSIDRYKALTPVFYNSIGASGSETLALTKMIIAGGYLPRDTKITLKRHGLFASAMLYLWKAGLPFDVPFTHELRHRVVYNSVGNRQKYPGSYSYAGMNFKKACPLCHQYDEQRHVSNMMNIARNMEFPPPEAIVNLVNVSGAKTIYNRKKTILVQRTGDKPVKLKVSTRESYDVHNRPIKPQLKMIYGNPRTKIKKHSPNMYQIKLSYDKTLPRGRTSILVTTDNGRRKGNPAVINIYRSEGPQNHRPVLLGFQDRIIVPGKTVSMDLSGIDPEGDPVQFEKRSTDPGTLNGNHFTWNVPHSMNKGKEVTFIASDGTAGNSYNAKRISFHLKPEIFAQIKEKKKVGSVPFNTSFSAHQSFDRKGPIRQIQWGLFNAQNEKIEIKKGRTFQPIIQKPGRYRVEVTVKGPSGSDTNTMNIYAYRENPHNVSNHSKPVHLYGKNTLIPLKNSKPRVGNGTNFDRVSVGEQKKYTYRIFNPSNRSLHVRDVEPIQLTSDHSKSFHLTSSVGDKIPSFGTETFTVQFHPEQQGAVQAMIRIHLASRTIQFPITGYGE